MKKNLLVLLVVGLMVALLGAPVFADDGHDGHVDGHGEVVLTPEDVTEALDDADEMTSEDVSDDDSNFTTLAELDLDDVESDDPIFVNAATQIFDAVSEDASVVDVEILAGAFHTTIASSDDELVFTSAPSDLTFDRVFLLVSPDWVEAELDASDDSFSLKAAAAGPDTLTLKIADNSSADLNPASYEVDFAFLAVHEVAASTGGGGGGCNVASIAPMAGLLVLPLLMLIKR